MDIRIEWESTFAASRQQRNIDLACQAWCAAMAQRADQRRFSPDVFVIDGLTLARDNFLEITDQRLKVRVALWIYATLSMTRPGSPECEHWEEVVFAFAAKSGTPADNLAIGVVAAARRVWQGIPVGRLAGLKQRLDALANDDSVNCRAAMAWLGARTHVDLVYGPVVDGVAQAAMLADCLERIGRSAMDPDCTPLGSAEFMWHLYSARIEDASACLHRTAHLAHRLGPYDLWMFWFYRTALNLAAGDQRSAMLNASRALAAARQSAIPHAVFWGKLAVARAFGAAPTGSGIWRRLADARHEAQALGSELFVALCRMASAIVAAGRGRMSRAGILGQAALGDIEAVQMLRPHLFTSTDFELIFRCVDAATPSAVSAPMLRSLYGAGRANRSTTAIHHARDVEIRCLGAFSVARGGSVLAWSRKTPRRPLDVLKALIASGREGASVAQLTDTLWPQMDGDRAHHAFGTALYRLRALIGDGVLDLRAGRLTLNRERAWVDVFEFEDEVAAYRHAELGDTRVLLALYGGGFLADQMEGPWATAAHNRLRELFRTVVRARAEKLLTGGHWHDALDLLEQALKRDPLAEIFYQRALAACSAGGLRAEAAAYYERCRDALSVHLGISPSTKTELLYREVLRAAR